MSFKVIITGTTGMVGEGVLLECLAHPQISEVLSVSRKAIGRKHAKLKEFLVPDFLNLSGEEVQLKGYDACFFCAGVSSLGMKEADYRKITYDTTLHFAEVALKQNPTLTFVYVSGASTDSSEKGRLMWARIKGKTENMLSKMPFKKVYLFRPGFMKPHPQQKNVATIYKYIGKLYPLFKWMMPNSTSTLQQVGQAMIHSLIMGGEKQVLEVKDINKMGNSETVS